ncbi:unnamed protein product [Brachionus calyciflorus]|uniref:MULE transposase domain-containing protein n=1 Tax=Brachionus calyciflorus TaxID=104777 RepID=A0A814F1G9_9BILA|nr:unnamed protein product [Brachionus calyciflorus]
MKELFLLFDSGADDKDRFFIFGNEKNLKLLEKSHIFADGTFDIAPKLFSQVYSLHVYLKNQSYAIVYAILPFKTEKIYIDFLSKVKSKLEFDPFSISCDFEMALIVVLCNIHPNDVLEMFNLIKSKLNLANEIHQKIKDLYEYFVEVYVRKVTTLKSGRGRGVKYKTLKTEPRYEIGAFTLVLLKISPERLTLLNRGTMHLEIC